MATGKRRARGVMRRPGFLGAGLVLLSTVAQAADEGRPLAIPCFSYAEVVRQLKGTYAEAPVSLGLQSNGNLLQVFSSAESGTWTILSTSPDGNACVLAAGNNWELVKPARFDPAA